MADENRSRDNEARDRDEAARSRDETSRTRDELSRDREAFSRKATKAARNFQTWVAIVLIVMVAGLFYTISQRNVALEQIQESAMRIERAATNTEEVLSEVVEAQRTPEAVAQTAAVRRALQDISTIRQLLCSFPELETDEACIDDP